MINEVKTNISDQSRHLPTKIAAEILPANIIESLDSIVNSFVTYEPQKLVSLLAESRAAADLFLKEFEASEFFLTSPELEQEWNTWIASTEGQKLSAEMAHTIVGFLVKLPLNGEPAHDKRHVLVKDPLAGLALCLEDNLKDSKVLFLIPAIAHDAGRLVEPAYDTLTPQDYKGTAPYENADHTKLSFQAFKQVMNLFEIPKSLKDHLLYAVLQHQGKNDPDTGKFFLYGVQRADRLQLVGPEGLLRQMAEDLTQVRHQPLSLKTNLDDKYKFDLPLPYREVGGSWFRHLEFYLRNLYPVTGSLGKEASESRQVVTSKFLYIATIPEVRDQIFAPEILRDKTLVFQTGQFKKPLSQEMWNQIKESLPIKDELRMRLLVASNSLEQLASLFCNAPCATPIDVVKAPKTKSPLEIIQQKAAELNQEELNSFKMGIAYAILARDSADSDDGALITKVQAAYCPTEVPHIIASAISAQLLIGSDEQVSPDR